MDLAFQLPKVSNFLFLFRSLQGERESQSMGYTEKIHIFILKEVLLEDIRNNVEAENKNVARSEPT